MSRHLLRAAGLVLVAFIACESPLEPFRPLGQGELVPVNRLIEDAISGGVDRNYSFNVDADGEYVVFLSSQAGFVFLGVFDPVTHYTLASVGSQPGDTPPERTSSNVPTHEAGVLTLNAHVVGGGDAHFQFRIYRVNRAPEHSSASFVFGDTVNGETIDPAVDADVFTAHGDSGQIVTVAVQPLGPLAGGISLYSEGPTGEEAFLIVAAPGEPLMTSLSGSLNMSGDSRLVVRGTDWQGHPRHRGPYRILSYVTDTAPEHGATSLAIQAVRNERLDYPPDVDVFTFQDTVGAELILLAEGSATFMAGVESTPGLGIVSIVDRDADTTLMHHGTAAFRLTSAGPYRVSVRTANGPPMMADTGAYRVMLFRLNRAPESIPAAIQIGDTVSGEAILPAGDVDQFTVSATPGTQLSLRFRLTSAAVPSFSSVAFEVRDVATGATLSQSSVFMAAAFAQGSTFTVPAGGSLQIRVGQMDGGGSPGSAPYEFFLDTP
jgi:hypothetical protein